MPLPPDAILALLAAAPFVAGLLAPLAVRLAGGHAGWLLALAPGWMVWALLGFLGPVSGGEAVALDLAWAPGEGIGFSLLLDGLSLVFALTIAGIGALVLVYSGAYLSGHPHQGRFLGFLLFFMGAMTGLVLADSLIVLFVFWELTSVASFLLIGFDHARQAARRAAIQALVVTNIGGLALLAGAVLLHAMGGSWEVSALVASGFAAGAHPAYGAALALVLLAAFTKSAQFPFHFWLPNAMEAPTPVSAFLHSATMVQAGVYLLARLSPVMGGTALWTGLLTTFGAITLAWGAAAALRETDLKLMLAQTTLASLGLLVLLLGVGGEAAILAVMLYFLAHAAYKAGLFLLVGGLDHATGTREIAGLGGLGRVMPLSFAGALLAALSMLGLPVSLGYLAKEEIYLALAGGGGWALLLLAVVVAGNAVLGGIGLAVALKPFLGPRLETPRAPHESGPSLLAGPLLLGAAGVGLALATGWLGATLLEPAGAAILGAPLESHLRLVPDFGAPPIWLSLLTVALAIAIYARIAQLRGLLRRLERRVGGWSFDRAFDALMFGLVRLAWAVTRFFHHGRLDIYLVTLFGVLGLALFGPFLAFEGLARLAPTDEAGFPTGFDWPGLTVYEVGIVVLALGGLMGLVLARSRLAAILALGVQGVAVALLFLLFGAPDLGFTQFMVEILSVVILTLVMTRLDLDARDHRPFEPALRDGVVALVCGTGVALLLASVLEGVFDPRLGEMYLATSVPLAHGHNVVNVILVDYRGLDTLGEIAVVMTAGIAILALLRGLAPRPAPAGKPVSPRRPAGRKSAARPARRKPRDETPETPPAAPRRARRAKKPAGEAAS